MIYGTRTFWLTLGVLALLAAFVVAILFADKFYNWRHGDDNEWDSVPVNEDTMYIEDSVNARDIEVYPFNPDAKL